MRINDAKRKMKRKRRRAAALKRKKMRRMKTRKIAENSANSNSIFTFQSNESVHPVDREVWQKIYNALPSHYAIPDPVFLKVIKRHSAKKN